MKHVFFNLLLTLIAFFCIGCATLQPSMHESKSRPADFAVEYEWREGSRPPPYHYEYSISVRPAGDGEIVLIPNYPADGVPRWTEKFQIAERDLNELYRAMAENRLFTQQWRQLEPAPIGGSNQTLVVTARGKRIKVADYLISGQQAPARVMYAAVRALVPREIWDQMQARREQYMREYPRR